MGTERKVILIRTIKNGDGKALDSGAVTTDAGDLHSRARSRARLHFLKVIAASEDSKWTLAYTLSE